MNRNTYDETGGWADAVKALTVLLEAGDSEQSLFIGLVQKLSSPCGLCLWEALLETEELDDRRLPLRHLAEVQGRLCERHARWLHGVAQAAHDAHPNPLRILDAGECRPETNPLSMTWDVLDVANEVRDRAAEELSDALRARCPLCRQRARAILFVHSRGEIDAPDGSRWEPEDFCEIHRDEIAYAAGEWEYAHHVREPQPRDPAEAEH
jgi:hypothetical protein